MITIKEHINNLISANAKHIAELTTEDEVKHWLYSLLWAVAGFKQHINEEELDKLAEEYIQGFDYAIEISPNLLSLKKDRALAKSVFKAGYRKAMEEKI